tara:strand:+ start:5765 stop:7744 length:1980 start_codon:yes stop_codon:yes gene_type:complete
MYKFIIILSILIFSIVPAQSIQELQKMKNEYDKMKKQSQLPINIQNPELTNTTINDAPSQVSILPYTAKTLNDSLRNKSRYFGYDFFTKRDTIGFWENLSVPNNYVLGPGDEIVISLWGETSLRQTFTVSRSGKIYDEKVGILNMSGKNVGQAKKYILNEFGRVYSTLNGSSPSTFLDLSLGTLKSINVNFVGEVSYPGLYAIHPFSNVITGLIQAGGVDTTGSLRSILIKRKGEVFTEVDLYAYLLKGGVSKDIQLKDQDIVLVPIRQSTISVDSSVFRPGIYESVNGESIDNIITYAGGLKPDAGTAINIQRIIPHKDRTNKKINNQNFYIEYNQSKNFVAQNGDKITINKMKQSIRQVELIGQVKKPGVYGFYSGMSLYNLIDLGGGFNDSTFWKSVYTNQAEIVRVDPLTRYEKVIKIDLSRKDNEEYFRSIFLQNLDRFVVHSNVNFFKKKNIQINGEVNIPGSYPLITDKENLQDLINRAGGLTPNALENGISIFRDKNLFEAQLSNENMFNEFEGIKKNKVRVAWESENIILMPGDSIIIKEKTGIVNVVGEVYNPGLIEYKRGKSAKRYINDAGGITQKGNKRGIVVVYANGVVVPKKWYTSPKIDEGSTIIINQKETTEPFDITQFVTNWTQILSSLITAVVLSQQIGNN